MQVARVERRGAAAVGRAVISRRASTAPEANAKFAAIARHRLSDSERSGQRGGAGVRRARAERVRVAVDVLHRRGRPHSGHRQEGERGVARPTSGRRQVQANSGFNGSDRWPNLSQADDGVRLERTMALLDRFRTQSRHKNPDPAVRLAFVQEIPLEERELLAEIAREDTDARVRRAAVAKLMDPAALAARGERRRRRAGADRRRSACCATSRSKRSKASARRRAAPRSTRCRHEDAGRDRQERAARVDRAARAGAGHRQSYARLDRPSRRARIGAPRRHSTAAAITARSSASRSTAEFKDPTVAAVERITERGELEQIAARAKNKSASKRARGILREADERAAQGAAAAAQAAAGRRRPRRSWPRPQLGRRRNGRRRRRPSPIRPRSSARQPRPRRDRPRKNAHAREAARTRARAGRGSRTPARGTGRGRARARRGRRRSGAEGGGTPPGAAGRAGGRSGEGRAARRPGGGAAAVHSDPARMEQPGRRRRAPIPKSRCRYAEAEAAFTARDTAAHEYK